jgi:uncharacterized protein (DUF1501 family)
MKKINHKTINRRTFLKTTAAAATAVASPLLASDNSDEYKALVCILLEGGADTLGMVIPKHNLEAYSHYSNVRAEGLQMMAVDRAKVKPLLRSRYGFHPQMKQMQGMYNLQNLAIVANVGMLNEPVTKAKLESHTNTLNLPDQLFSKAVQRDLWMRAGGSASGWAARVADILGGEHVNISVGGQNSMQQGGSSEPLIAHDEHAGVLGDPANIMGRLRKLDIAVHYDAKAEGKSLGEQLEIVASLMAARESAGFAKQQIYFVRHNSWDTEGMPMDVMQKKDSYNLKYLDHALGRFSDTIAALGLHDKVTTFTTADLNRGITPDGYGCSRGWAGHAFVMGGAVKAGIYGTMPSIAPGSPDMMTNGAVIPTISSDQYLATLVDWLGDGQIDLDAVFPNLAKFEKRTLGFMV